MNIYLPQLLSLTSLANSTDELCEDFTPFQAAVAMNDTNNAKNTIDNVATIAVILTLVNHTT